MIDMSTRRRNGVIHTFFITNHFFTKIYKVNNPLKQGFRQAIAQEDTGQLYGDEECDLILFLLLSSITHVSTFFFQVSASITASVSVLDPLCANFFSRQQLYTGQKVYLSKRTSLSLLTPLFRLLSLGIKSV